MYKREEQQRQEGRGREVARGQGPLHGAINIQIAIIKMCIIIIIVVIVVVVVVVVVVLLLLLNNNNKHRKGANGVSTNGVTARFHVF